MGSPGTDWPLPKRILLLTYDRTDHLLRSYERGVVGVPDDRASITKASGVFRGDWALIRLSDLEGFQASRPALITGRGIHQNAASPYPLLLWPEEEETGKVQYPFRIPVTFDGGPRTRARAINWQTLADLKLKGMDGAVLETPQQWGIKFSCNVLAGPDASSLHDLIMRSVV